MTQEDLKGKSKCSLCRRIARLLWTVHVVCGVFTRLESRGQQFCVKCMLVAEKSGAIVNREPHRILDFPCKQAA